MEKKIKVIVHNEVNNKIQVMEYTPEAFSDAVMVKALFDKQYAAIVADTTSE